MLFGRLYDEIYTRAAADTGVGGFFQTGSPMLRGFYRDGENINAEFPYISVAPVSEQENDVFDTDPRAVEIVF